MQHRDLAAGQWSTLSLCEQMANIGSEVERAIKWKSKNNQEYAYRAFIRALELLDLSLMDEKNRTRCKELCRVRETLADYFYFDNTYHSTDAAWHRYFHAFTWAAQRRRYDTAGGRLCTPVWKEKAANC